MKATEALTDQEIKAAYIGQSFTMTEHGEIKLTDYKDGKFEATTKEGNKIYLALWFVHHFLQLIK